METEENSKFEEIISSYFENHHYFKSAWNEHCDAMLYLHECAWYFYELGKNSK